MTDPGGIPMTVGRAVTSWHSTGRCCYLMISSASILAPV